MSVIIVLIIIDTIAQFFVCGFSFWWIMCLISRLLFCCRAIGAIFKVKTLCKIEVVAIGINWLFHVVFKGDGFPWMKFLLFILFVIIAVFLMFLDEWLYVYDVEDVDDDDVAVYDEQSIE